MPLHSSFDLPGNGRLFVWRITESVEELAALGSNSPFLPVCARHPKRIRESLAALALLEAINYRGGLSYLPNGKPVTGGSGFISFSHCGDLVGFALSDSPLGIDIQDKNEKLLKIASRFCGEEELSWLSTQRDSMACTAILWAAKEAVFKIFGEELTFSEDIRVQPFNSGNQLPLQVECRRNHQWMPVQTSRNLLLGYWIVTGSLAQLP